MATPTLKHLQTRVNQIVSESKDVSEAIWTARADPLASKLLQSILIECIAAKWTKKIAKELKGFLD